MPVLLKKIGLLLTCGNVNPKNPHIPTNRIVIQIVLDIVFFNNLFVT